MATATDEKDKAPAETPEVKQPESVDAIVAEGNTEDEAAYEAEFQRLAAKREAEKRGETVEPEPAPAEEPAKAEPEAKEPVPSPEPPAPVVEVDYLAAVTDPKARDALAKRLKEADEDRARAKKLDLDNRSMAGRMSAYQRKYEEAAGMRPVDVQQKATEEATAEWKQFAEDYPDIAKAIETRLEAKTGSTPELAEVVEYVENEKRTRFMSEAYDAVEAVHPGWRNLGKSQEFKDWLQTSPTYGRLASSDDIADAIALFDIWYARNPAPANPNKSTPREADQAAKLSARRAEQAEGARSPNDRGATPNQGVDLSDEDQLFAAYAAKANKRLKERHG